MGFSFDEEQPAQDTSADQVGMAMGGQSASISTDQNADFSQPPTAQGTPAARRGGFLGMKTSQVIILGVILLVWLCAMIGFGAYIYFNLNV
jgi:hypothetical protein